MIKQIKCLTKLQLKNIYGLNVFRFTKDKKAKQKTTGMAVVWALLIAMVCFYVGMMAYGYILIGMAEILPAYLIMLSSLIILAFAIFKAGSVIFQKNAYDILCSLPVSQTAIVVSRFARMYVENLLLTFMIMLPGMAVYGVMVKPSPLFYLIGAVAMIFIPLIPITIATFLGALVTAITSRMKHKSLVSAALSVLLVVGVMLGTSQMTALEEQFSIEMLQNLSELVLTVIEGIYPPAVWFGVAMLEGDFGQCVLCMIGALLAFAVTIVLVSSNYHRISRGLYSTTAKHDFKMQSLKKDAILRALLKREYKRYFASSVYVTNTIVGPILAVVFAGAIFVAGLDTMQQALELPIDIKGAVPFLLAAIFCMMGTSCTSISMEGKEWWIIKSLPVRTKDVLDSKLLLNISLIAPFYLVSEVLLALALKPDFMELLWLVLIPAILILFSCVLGLTVNLKMPVFDWENEVTIVKQSASAFVGGIGGFVIVLICMVPVLFVPAIYANLLKGIICVVFTGLTIFLYRKNNAVNLQEL